MDTPQPATSGLVGRSALGGLLMGLANLVPGISGGTMLLAAGVYPRFIAAVAEVSTLKLRRPSVVVLGTVVIMALLAVVSLAGPIKDLVVERRWVMYSLFIGLTLGGLPVVWRLARPATPSTWSGAALGLAVMLALAFAQRSQGSTGSTDSNFVLLLVAGLAGASAMILPGVSGGYLLLVLGQYVPILTGIDAFKEALRSRDVGAAVDPALGVLLPVGLGVLVGVVGVSNALRWLLAHREKPTLGALLGLLVGAVAGLWPFQRMVDPVVGETIIKGQLVTAENLADFDPEEFPTEFFDPSGAQVMAALALVAAGFALTQVIARIGRSDQSPNAS